MASTSSAKKTVMTENAVTVGVRIRPMSDKELASSQCFFTASPDATNVQELDEQGACLKNWSYDHVFGPDCSNQYIFHTVGSKLVDAALDGYNTVLFMYGQTASGNNDSTLILRQLTLYHNRKDIYSVWRRQYNRLCRPCNGIR